MRRIEQLITASRRATSNLDFGENAGVQDEEFLQAFNDAQEEIQTLINTLFPTILVKQKTFSASVNVDTYNIPSDAFMGTRIENLEYSSTGLTDNFYVLKKGAPKERINGEAGNPSFYIRQGTQIIVQPPPQSGGLFRILYQRTIPVLDKRRATVLSAALDTSARTITSLYLDTTVELDDAALTEQNYITIVDKNGVVKMQGIPVDSINTGTGQVNVSAGFIYESGETIAAGDYAVRGKYSSTHSQLPDLCEKYLLEYCNMRIFVRDSSTDQAEVAALMSKIEETLKSAFSQPDNDPDRIVILDASYLGYEI